MSFKVFIYCIFIHSCMGDLALERNCFLVRKQYGGDNEKVDDRSRLHAQAQQRPPKRASLLCAVLVDPFVGTFRS